jgi:lysophospholipase L1-like esterase
MKKVLLLGDSIRMGYEGYVRELLRGNAEVYSSEDNGRFAAYTLWQANQMLKLHQYDVVHWNNGYWDMNIEAPMTEAIHPVDEYLHFLKRILSELRKNGAKVIFATTTPILEAGTAVNTSGADVALNYNNAWVLKYNEAAKRLMAEENVPVNDLYTLCAEDEHYYKCADLLHLTDEGYKKCAEEVVRHIETLL